MSTSKQIPFFGLDRQYQSIKKEILDITDKVYSTGIMLDGPYVLKLEEQIKKITNRKYAVAVNSCTQALQFALRVTDGNSVLVPNFSFIATKNSVEVENKTPIFVGVDANGLMDLDKIDVTNQDVDTIVYVNLYGNIIDYDRLRFITKFFTNKEICIIEDAAQSFGGSYKGIPSGKLGDISCLSFDPTKNLPNYGSGGMILTDDIYVAEYTRKFKSNNRDTGGTNSKLSEVDAAQLLVKLNHFGEWQKRRTEIANYYNEHFEDSNVRLPRISKDVVHAWHKYVIYVNNRYDVALSLETVGIETKVHYSYSLDDNAPPNIGMTAYCMSLPMYPELTDAEVEYIVKMVKQYT